MGLDMNLYKRYYLSAYDEKGAEVKKKLEKIKIDGMNMSNIRYITEELMYWRKANAIHNWFVQNCNDGEDNNGNFDVQREHLQDLLETINKVLASTKLIDGKVENGYSFDKNNKKVYNYEDGKILEDSTVAEELLPTQAGFFFGGTGYDEYYWNMLEDTKKMLEAEIKLFNEIKTYWVDYEYHASW